MLLYLTLGFSDIGIPLSSLKTLLNLFHCTSIRILKLRVCGDAAIVRIYTKHEGKALSLLQGQCIEARVFKRSGLPQIWRRYRHRTGLLLGIALLFIMLSVSPLFIWEINITGNERLSVSEITELLRKEGVCIGAFSPAIDRRTVYTNILLNAKDISWMSLNLQGSSANVEIVERAELPSAQVRADAANIVAKKDGMIFDLQIRSGRSVVQKGEAVRKGTVLVSGVYDTDTMGTRYVYAEAAVYAVVNDAYTIEIPLLNTRRVYGEEKRLAMSIKMFGKSINILKNSFNSKGKYDTIYREDTLPSPWLSKLPISLKTVWALPFEETSVQLTETQALELAKQELFRKLSEEAEYADILSLTEGYTVENSTLVFRCDVEAIENIAATSPFAID